MRVKRTKIASVATVVKPLSRAMAPARRRKRFCNHRSTRVNRTHTSPPHGARQRGHEDFHRDEQFLLKRKHRVNRVCPPISCAQKRYPSFVLFSEVPQVYCVGGAADLLLFDGVFATARRQQIITLHTIRLLRPK